MRIKRDYVCSECGHQFDDAGDGRCYVCGGSIIPIDEVGEEEQEYSEELMEETESIPPEDLEEEIEEEKEDLEEQSK